MKENLKSLNESDFDFIMFFNSVKKDIVDVETMQYKDRGEVLELHPLGNKYHIILCKQDGDNILDIDLFEAILIDPFTYLYELIPQGWRGMICKKTTTSDNVVDIAIDKMKERS